VTRLPDTIQLIGKILVDQVVDEDEAKRQLGPDVWEAPDHLLAREPVCRYRFDVFIPIGMLTQLEFVHNGGTLSLKFDREGNVDRQTLRGLREITASTAGLFDSLL
jgi:hypothetical protein